MKDHNPSSASKPMTQMPGQMFSDFVPTNPTADPLNLSMNFNGSLEDAANYYYKEANKLYFANLVLNNQLKTVMDEKTQLAQRLAKLEKEKGENTLIEEKKKRHRRTANQIQRSYKCPVEPCQKAYGSEGSLSQHLKLKHNEFYKSHMINLDLADKPKEEGDSQQESSSVKDKKNKEDIVM